MKASAAKEKASQLGPSRPRDRAPRLRAPRPARASGPSLSYPKTRVRGSRLLGAAFILAIAELTRRLHQAYGLAYDKPAVGSVLPQNPPVDKLYGGFFACNRSANDLMRTIRRDFSKFGNFTETVAGGLIVAGIEFDEGAIEQGRTIGITVGAISTTNPPVAHSRRLSVTVSSASTSGFTFTTDPGHVFYPGTITFSASDTDSGVHFSISLKGELGDLESKLGFAIGGGDFEDHAWKSFVAEVRKSCGNQ